MDVAAGDVLYKKGKFLAALFLLTLVLAKLRGRLSAEREKHHLNALRHLPSALQQVLKTGPPRRVLILLIHLSVPVSPMIIFIQ